MASGVRRRTRSAAACLGIAPKSAGGPRSVGNRPPRYRGRLADPAHPTRFGIARQCHRDPQLAFKFGAAARSSARRRNGRSSSPPAASTSYYYWVSCKNRANLDWALCSRLQHPQLLWRRLRKRGRRFAPSAPAQDHTFGGANGADRRQCRANCRPALVLDRSRHRLSGRRSTGSIRRSDLYGQFIGCRDSARARGADGGDHHRRALGQCFHRPDRNDAGKRRSRRAAYDRPRPAGGAGHSPSFRARSDLAHAHPMGRRDRTFRRLFDGLGIAWHHAAAILATAAWFALPVDFMDRLDQSPNLCLHYRFDWLLRGVSSRAQRRECRSSDHSFGRGGDISGHCGRCRVFNFLFLPANLIMTEKSSEPVICVRGLVNRFGTETVHDGLDLDVVRGEVIGIVGGSGSGKSVLLRTIVGLNRPIEGKVEVFGRDILRMSDRQRRVLENRWGVLFQDGALFSSLTVAQNIEVPIKEYYDMPLGLMDEISAVKVGMVGLPEDAGEKYPSQLSGGMRKRAGLARALALDPEIVFLDEPTAGLDPIAAGAFDELIRDLKGSLGLTVFMVTHDLDSLFAICDRVAVLVDKKVRVGTLEQLLKDDHPWIHAYFHGRRGRAAQHGEADAPATSKRIPAPA